MSQLIVRRLDDDVKRKLQSRAARHGHSMEAEVRDILRDAVKREEEAGYDASVGLGTLAMRRFAGLDLEGEEFDAMPREELKPVDFDR